MGNSIAQKQMEAIGKMAVEFSKLEWSINSFIGWLINNEDDKIGVGQVVTAAIHSFSVRINLLFSLYKYRASRFEGFGRPLRVEMVEEREKSIDKIKELCEEAKTVNGKRNKIIHSFWFTQERHMQTGELTGIKIDLDGTKKIEKGNVGRKYIIPSSSVEDLNDLIDEIMDLTQRIMEFHEAIKNTQT